jgi:hypothetical protein
MQFSSALLAATILAVTKAAQFTNTAAEFDAITAGTPFNITWADASGPVTLILKDGPINNLQTVLTIQSKSLPGA